MAVSPWLDSYDSAILNWGEMDPIFEEQLAHEFSGWPLGPVAETTSVPVDMYEQNEAFVVRASLPGIDFKALECTVSGSTLKIAGRFIDNDCCDDEIYLRERSWGEFERAIALPMHIRPGKVKATYKDGILEIKVPK